MSHVNALDAGEVIPSARAETGLEDFGDQSLKPALRQLPWRTAAQDILGIS